MGENRRLKRYRLFEQMVSLSPSIAEAGCRIGVGPALGIAEAFVGTADELDVEVDRLIPYAHNSSLRKPAPLQSNLFIANPWTEAGDLVDLNNYPKLKCRLSEFRKRLSKRSCVKTSTQWFRTIDKLSTQLSRAEKILIAGIARRATLQIDSGQFIPDHGTYWIQSLEWPLLALSRVLNAGVLDLTAECLAPVLNNGYLRFNKRVISSAPIPYWKSIAKNMQAELTDELAVPEQIIEAVASVYGLSRKKILALVTDQTD